MEGRQSGSSHKRSAPISTEIGNKVPAGSVNRFAPDSWPYTGRTVSVRGGMGGQEGVQIDRESGRVVCVVARACMCRSSRGKGGLTIKY